MEIGVDSFIAATVDAAGRAVDPAQHLSELLEAIRLADEVGLDVFGIGEHHRREFLDSAPTVILAAAAARTAGLARRRRYAGLFYSRQHARAPINGRHHRRGTAPFSAIDRSLP